MPVTFHVSLVDWRALHKGLLVERTYEELLELVPPEPTELDHCSWQWDFMKQLEEVIDHWPTGPVRNLDRLFSALFCACPMKNHQIMELELLPHRIPQQFESAWSPATVKEFASLWNGVRFEDLRPHFRPRSCDKRGFQTFEEFRDFAQFFGELIVRGASEGRGLVVFVHV